jgi:hypothetical protein
MANNKILIMAFYYERPLLVVEAIKSILRANKHYDNWHLAFHDDASQTPGEPIVKNLIPEDMLDKVTFYRTVATKEQKLASGGMLGHVTNQMLKDSDADIAIILCDDDILHEMYLSNLNIYFNNHPQINACYSHAIVFDPGQQSWEDSKNTDNPLNHYTTPINPENKLDACQVAWRISLNKEKNVWFPYPCHKNQDAGFYKAIYESIGVIPFSGFVGQYKAIHAEQLCHVGQSENIEEIMSQASKMAMMHYLNKDYEEAARLYEQINKIKIDDNKNALKISITSARMLKICKIRIEKKNIDN